MSQRSRGLQTVNPAGAGQRSKKDRMKERKGERKKTQRVAFTIFVSSSGCAPSNPPENYYVASSMPDVWHLK